MIGAVDKFIVEQAPWKLAKAGDAEAERLDEVLYTSAEALRIVTALLGPVLPRVGGEDLGAAWIRNASRPHKNGGFALGPSARAARPWDW